MVPDSQLTVSENPIKREMLSFSNPSAAMRGVWRIALAIILAFSALLVLVGATVPFVEAIIATGEVSITGRRSPVQVLVAGRVKDVYVAEGDTVRPGDPILALDDIVLDGNALTDLERYRQLRLREARLNAELKGAQKFTVSTEILEALRLGADSVTVKAEQALFKTRVEQRATKISLLKQTEAKLRSRLKSEKTSLVNLRRQLGFAQEEVEGVETLYNKGLSPRPKLLALKKEEAQLRSAIAQTQASIATTETSIIEAKLAFDEFALEDGEMRQNALAETKMERIAAEKEREASQSRLDEAVVIAPVEGRITDLKFAAGGAVVSAGETVADVVPKSGAMYVAAAVIPMDIGTVYPSQRARIEYIDPSTALPQSVDGLVDVISADSKTNEKTGEAFYDVQIRVAEERSDSSTLAGFAVGTPVTVYLIKSEKTFWGYLSASISKHFQKAVSR